MRERKDLNSHRAFAICCFISFRFVLLFSSLFLRHILCCVRHLFATFWYTPLSLNCLYQNNSYRKYFSEKFKCLNNGVFLFKIYFQMTLKKQRVCLYAPNKDATENYVIHIRLKYHKYVQCKQNSLSIIWKVWVFVFCLHFLSFFFFFFLIQRSNISEILYFRFNTYKEKTMADAIFPLM